MVDRRVLIPRPETEQVVEVALAELDRMAASRPVADRTRPDRRRSRDRLGRHRPGPRGRAGPGRGLGDRRLAGRPGGRRRQPGPGWEGGPATRVRLAGGSWWAALPADLRGRVDLVVSNPPYVATAEMVELDVEVAEWEPRLALEAGPTGLEAVGEILGGARDVAAPDRRGGDRDRPPSVRGRPQTLARGAGFAAVEVRPDLAGRDRILVARGAAVTVVLDARGEPPAAGVDRGRGPRPARRRHRGRADRHGVRPGR